MNHVLASYRRVYVFLGARTILRVVGLFSALVGICLLGCDPVQRHRILTFFFDGVPPLPSEIILLAPDANNIFAGGPQPPDQQRGSKHKPYENCSNCHISDPGTGQPILKSPAPQLCYACHTDYGASRAFVHGPVAVGACLVCHNPHFSKLESLLRAPQPYLCFQCHEAQTVRAAPNHPQEDIDRCVKCHESHVGTTRMFLKTY